MNNAEAQNEELLALQSIYDPKYFIVERMSPACGRYLADVQLSDPFYVTLRNDILCSNESGADCSKLDYEEFEVKYLPPIILHFEYPEDYPSSCPPAFFLSSCWLSHEQLSRLCKHLDVLWLDGNGEVILFQWIQFLKEEALSFLNIDGCLDITELSKYKLKLGNKNSVPFNEQSSKSKCVSSDNRNCSPELNIKSDVCSNTSMPVVKPLVSGGSGERDLRAFLDIADGKVLKNLLKDYNELKKGEYFHDSWHQCNICFANKQGSEFVTFKLCHHFFCRDCIKSYFELMIWEGSVHSLNCPHDQCNTQADGSLVKQIVSKDSFERYDSLLLTRTLDTMSDIAYCPRKACQCPLLIDVSERMGTCPACNFVFCPFCKMAYHGIAPCRFDPALKQQICDDYLRGDSNKKAEFENRYGKRTIKLLVEEVLSEKWIGSNSKHCPHCNASIEKNEGCNKMTCYRCGTFFCWLCTKQLQSANPYAHFSERGSDCFNKLYPEEYMVDEFMFDEFEAGEFLNF